MRNLSIIMQCTIALVLVLYGLKGLNAAPTHNDLGNNADREKKSENLPSQASSLRQAHDEDSYEDSGEDDGEDDAEQAHLNLIEQQNQQNLEESQEFSDEDDVEDDAADDDEVRHRRHRRETNTDTESNGSQVATIELPPDNDKEQMPNSTVEPNQNTETIATTNANASASASTSFNRTSVLILIRDTLKKVTTVLPTEQVATNALQYFQLFEHFLQQTIERVIDDYDDDDDEQATTVKIDNETVKEKVENNINVTPEISTVVKDDSTTEKLNEFKIEEPLESSTNLNLIQLQADKTPVEISN